MFRSLRTLVPCLINALIFALLCSGSLAHAQIQEVGDGGPGPVKAQHLTAELVSLAPAVAPGGKATIGLVLTMEEHWHVYWINAGDSGEPPQVRWTTPAGVTLGAMQFPSPTQLPLGPLMDFGYEDTAAFPFPLTIAPTVKPGPIHLDARVNWLVCREVCIPGKAHLGLDLNVAPGAAPGQPVGALGQALSNLPKPLPARFSISAVGGKTDLVLTLKTGDAEEDAEFYPFDADQIQNAAEQVVEPMPDGVRLRLKRSPELTTLPDQLHGLIKLSDTETYEFKTPLTAGEIAPPAGTPKKETVPQLTTIGAIGLALIGGIILNLMPCVFPVLFLKALGLVQSSGEERSRQRNHGLVYTLGILVSFWLIVGILLVVRAGGSQAGWGFQLQSPTFIAALALFLFFFSMSLAGQFDIGLTLTSVGGSLAQKHGYTGSFFTGVLATVVATPCTAPFMGAAIGFALAQSAWITFAVFTALGFGLALPYLILTLQPAWISLLPKPGAWMEILKQVSSIPLFITVIGLVWVYGRMFNADSALGDLHQARLMIGFLLLAIAGWALGRYPARRTSTIAAVVLGVAAFAIPLSALKAEKLNWQPYSAAALTQARAAGHPVFIDFTAAWCLSCHVNEKVVLDSADVVDQLGSHDFVLLRADWTNYDSAITQELSTIGRSGVPTYVFYSKNQNSRPDVLPELLSKGLVLKAIDKATGQTAE